MTSVTTRSTLRTLQTLVLGFSICGSVPPLALANGSQETAAYGLADRDIVGPYIAAALENNPELQAAEKRYQAARQSIDYAGALPNPRVQLTHFVESIQTRTGPQRQAISLQQPLPWFGKLDTTRQIARSQSEALWHSYASQQFELADKIASSVLEIAFLDKAIAITKQNASLLNRLEAIVEDKVKAGGDLSDLLKIQVEAHRLEDTLASQETKRVMSLATLQSLLGSDSETLQLPSDWNAPSLASTQEQEWLDAIRQRSPKLAMLRSLAENQASRERLAQFAAKPDLSVGINYIRTGQSLGSNAPDNGRDPWAIMVGISLPIWGKANNAIALQASLEKEAMEADIRGLELELNATGKSLLARLADSKARMIRYETKLLPLARQAQEISASSYQTGKASILDLIDSERALLKLETEYWRAAADAWQARWKLASLAGGFWLN
ncbi:TolC family protein [Pelagicoccus sp. NFK12]|uniref:TolC family protein n=1 Tax=Pelagicoccus enzymogenes TaxID=2773457 RepID=A0A927F950_9BACT|nr:TolC family protein [Pelagicoccus enzymogenes]MBD5780609.1 TolC family protein [Pelagicoccus enzymogenes]